MFLFCSSVVLSADIGKSPYKNNEKHTANAVDVNYIPIDKACKLQMLWHDVQLKDISRIGVPNNVIKNMTVVKFNFLGAWIAWYDGKTYNEVTGDYIPWRCFPDEIKEHFESAVMPDFKTYKSKKAFSLRTPQTYRGKVVNTPKTAKVINHRSGGGLRCVELRKNIYIPFSEFPPEIRTACGFYENQSYIPSMPQMERGDITLKDKILYLYPSANNFRQLRRFKEGYLCKVTFIQQGKTSRNDIFIKLSKGRIEPNHKSDLHTFNETENGRICTKCNLSDHLNDKYFNFMFDRQSRMPCSIKHKEYAFVRSGNMKVGRRTLQAYEYFQDFDKKYPSDSEILWKKAKIVPQSSDGDAENTEQ